MTSTTQLPAQPVGHDEIHGPEWPWYGPDAVRRAQDLIARGRVFDYGHGPEIAELETHAAQTHGRGYCLAVNSGSSALLAAFVALGLGPGDEVITPTFTFATCASPLLLLGAVPVLADAGTSTGNVTVDSLRPHLTPRSRAVLVTHLFGEPCDLDAIGAWAARHGLATIEDCSHAHGARHTDGSSVGTKADIAVYSIGGVKTVSGGLGGLLLTDDETTYDLACLLSSFKQRSRATVRRPELAALADVGLGGNLRISPVAAVLAFSHLEDLDAIVRTKQHNAKRLESALSTLPGLGVIAGAPGADPGGRFGVHLRYDATVTGLSRDRVARELQRLGAKITEPKTRLLHRSSLFAGARPPRTSYPEQLWHRHFMFRPDDFPVASALHDSWLAMPATHLYGPSGDLADSYRTIAERVWEAASEAAARE